MITFVKARSGRGKTHFVFEEIAKDLATRKAEKIFLIVPDQMSFQTEYQLLSFQKKQAMIGVEVVGLHRFASRILEEIVPMNYIQFDSLAQKMLLYQSVQAVESELEIYQKAKDKVGFIDYLHQFFRQLKGSLLPIENLLVAKSLEHQPLLKKKLGEVQKVFVKYNELITSKAYDNADKIDYLQEQLINGQGDCQLEKIVVYVDGYYTFNKQEFELLAAVIARCQKAVMTFNAPLEGKGDHSLFSLVEKQYQQFSQKFPKAKTIGLEAKIDRFTATPILNQIEAEYEYPQSILSKNCKSEAVTLTSYVSKIDEVEGIAQEIRNLIIHQQVRAREIAIYVPDKESYGELIEQIFRRYEIPFYLDIKESMITHPVISWLYGLLKIEKDTWQFDDMISLLHNNFFQWKHGIAMEDVYVFLQHIENFTTTKKYVWENDKFWSYYDRPEQMFAVINEDKTDKINEIRKLLLTEISQVRTILTVRDHGKKLADLFLYMQEQNIQAYITAVEVKQSNYTSHITAKQYALAVWQQLVYVFEQANLAIGKQSGTKKDCLQILLFGLESMEFTSVPIGFDQVMIGDFERSRFQTLHQEGQGAKMGVNYSFILGLIDTYIPHVQAGGSLLTDNDLAILQANQMLDDLLLTEDALLYQLFHFYTIVTSASVQTNLSYFNKQGVYNDVECYKSIVLDTFGQSGFNIEQKVVSPEKAYIDYNTMTIETIKRQLFTQKSLEPSQKQMLEDVTSAVAPMFVEKIAAAFSYQNSVEISGNVITKKQLSLTQIETYNSCAYKYFLQYVVSVKQKYSGEVQALQSGTLLHDCFESVVASMLAKKLKISEVPLEIYQQEIDDYFQGKSSSLQDHPLFTMQANRFMLQKIADMSRTAFGFMYESDKYSDFMPLKLEEILPPHKIEINGLRKEIIGKVDRIDISKDGRYFRIVDYKSSQKSLDFNQIIFGTQLQLPLYSYLAAQTQGAMLAGSMYMPFSDKFIAIEGQNQEDITKLISKNYQASGFFDVDSEALEKFDYQIASNSKSDIIPYTAKKDGSPTSFSMVMTAAEINQMQNFSIAQAELTVQKISENKFDIEPFRQHLDESTTPCIYCKFKKICQFDRKTNSFNTCNPQIKGTGFQEKKAAFLVEIAKDK
ncbi:MAG: PD-(D/E)XK nuclease family protein [Culicoidibacterales bacterium]